METNERYEYDVFKRLEAFSNANGWSDLINLLTGLQATLNQYKLGYVPHYPLLVKRLNQCLNPALPAGVHTKTIEVYITIFKKLPKEQLLRDFQIFSLGILRFGFHCRIVALPDYLSFIKNYVLPIASLVPNSVKDVIIGMLPGIESESSEFFDYSLSLILSFANSVDPSIFYTALWQSFIEFPSLRSSIISLLLRNKELIVPDYKLVVRAYSEGFTSNDLFILRSVLDISDSLFPISLARDSSVHEASTKQIADTIDKLNELKEAKLIEQNDEPNLNEQGSNLNEQSANLNEQSANLNEQGSNLNEQHANLSTNLSTNLTDYTTNATTAQHEEQMPTIRITYLNSDELDTNLLESYNIQLVRSFLRVFLTKEAGMSRRGFKWLNMADDLENRTTHLEEGLRTYVRAGPDEIHTFFRLFKALSDKEGLSTELAESLIFDIIDSFIKSGLDAQKYASSFADLNLDDLWRVFFTSLSAAYKTDNQKDTNSVEQLINRIIYAVQYFALIDEHVRTFHLPLIALLISEHKSKQSAAIFYTFMELALNQSHFITDGTVVRSISELLHEAASAEGYERHSSISSKIDLMEALGRSLGDLNKYVGIEEGMAHYEGRVVDIDGLLCERAKLWNQTADHMSQRADLIDQVDQIDQVEQTADLIDQKDQTNKNTNKPTDMHSLSTHSLSLAFSHADLHLFQVFLFHFPSSLLPSPFVHSLNSFLLSHYQYILLIDLLGLNDKPLYSAIWNDYLRTGLVSYLEYYNISGYLIEKCTKKKKEQKQALRMLTQLVKHANNRNVLDLGQYSPKERCFIKNKTSTTYLDLIYYIACHSGHKTPEYLQLLFNLNDYQTIIEYLLSKLHAFNCESSGFIYRGQPDYRGLHGLIRIVRDMMKKQGFINWLGGAKQIEIRSDEFGALPPREAIISLMMHFILNSESTREAARETDDNDLECADVRRSALRTLYKLYSAGVPVRLSDIVLWGTHFSEPISNELIISRFKEVVAHHKNDFIILTSSLFLLVDDFNFIFSNCMEFYTEVFDTINKSNQKENPGLALAFFTALPRQRHVLSSPLLVESLLSLQQMANYQWNEFFTAALVVGMNEVECSEMQPKRIINEQAVKLTIQDVLGECYPPCGDLPNSHIQLFGILWNLNRELFITTFFGLQPVSSLVLILDNLNFRQELVEGAVLDKESKQINRLYRITHARLYLSVLSAEEHLSILRRFLPSPNTPLSMDHPQEILMALELIVSCLRSEQIALNEYRLLLERILMAVERRTFRCISSPGRSAVQSIRNDVVLLLALTPYVVSAPLLLQPFRNCVFNLLAIEFDTREPAHDIRKPVPDTREPQTSQPSTLTMRPNTLTVRPSTLTVRDCHIAALHIIESLIRSGPIQIVVQSFLGHFRGNFFDYNIHHKQRVISLLFSLPDFDPSELLDGLISSLDTSYFITTSSSLQIKAAALKRLAFLFLVNKHDQLVFYISRLVPQLIKLFNELPQLKPFIYPLCIAMILKVSHSHLINLYPVLVEDILSTLSGIETDPQLFSYIFYTFDLCIWLESSTLNFESLFILNERLRTELITKFGTCEMRAGTVRPLFDSSEGNLAVSNTNFTVGDTNLAFNDTKPSPSISVTQVQNNPTYVRDAQRYAYGNLFKMASKLEDLGDYLKSAPQYYSWARSSFMKRDLDGVLEDVLNELYQGRES